MSLFLRVPYLAKLDNAIQPGQTLIVRGVPTGKKLDVNLASGPNVEGYAGNNIALHVSWRESEKQIVLNTFENGQWQKEQHEKNREIHQGKPFDLRIRAHDDHFEVYLDHKQLTDFKYRLPLNAVTHVYVTGDVQLQALAWEGNYYPVPYKGNVPGNFGPGGKLFITGVPTKHIDKFEVNLYAGSDIALHFNPRFHDKHVVLNSKQGGSWGQEERPKTFPFSKEKQFDLVIVNESNAFQIFIDGQHYASFGQRVPGFSINSLGIEGELELQAIAFD